MGWMVLAAVLLAVPGAATSDARGLLKKGEDFPGFVVKGLSGQFFFLREHTGDKAKYRHAAIIFSFCQYDCKACRKEAPELEKTLNAFRDRGLAVYMVNVGEDEKTARKLADELKTSIPFLVDRYGVVWKLVGGTATPLTVLVDGAGKVHYVRPGFSEEKAEELRAELEEAVARLVGPGSGSPGR